MTTSARKLTFEEVIRTSSVFYNNETVEKWFNDLVKAEAKNIMETRKRRKGIQVDDVIDFLRNQPNGLRRILHMLHLSQEKFLRIITLVRKLDGTFDKEWNLKKIGGLIRKDDCFAKRLAHIFTSGKTDSQLVTYLPLFYRERLNLQSLEEKYSSEEELMIRLKDRYQGAYSNRKGDAVEELIGKKIESIGVTFESGNISFVDVSVDWAIPNIKDPYVILMSSYQETTSSGQSTKARDMLACYQAINRRNIQHGENRAFVNFVDGGGWLARQNDLRRLVEGCHYFLNLSNLDMLEDIIRKHVPRSTKHW